MRWEWTYPPEERAATVARGAAIQALPRTHLTDEVRDAAELVVGELVANAIRHASTEFTVAVDLDRACLVIEVFDADPRPPTLVATDPGATSGRGLHLVAAISRAWGWETADRDGITGKVVWAELGTGATDSP